MAGEGREAPSPAILTFLLATYMLLLAIFAFLLATYMLLLAMFTVLLETFTVTCDRLSLRVLFFCILPSHHCAVLSVPPSFRLRL